MTTAASPPAADAPVPPVPVFPVLLHYDIGYEARINAFRVHLETVRRHTPETATRYASVVRTWHHRATQDLSAAQRGMAALSAASQHVLTAAWRRWAEFTLESGRPPVPPLLEAPAAIPPLPVCRAVQVVIRATTINRARELIWADVSWRRGAILDGTGDPAGFFVQRMTTDLRQALRILHGWGVQATAVTDAGFPTDPAIPDDDLARPVIPRAPRGSACDTRILRAFVAAAIGGGPPRPHAVADRVAALRELDRAGARAGGGATPAGDAGQGGGIPAPSSVPAPPRRPPTPRPGAAGKGVQPQPQSVAEIQARQPGRPVVAGQIMRLLENDAILADAAACAILRSDAQANGNTRKWIRENVPTILAPPRTDTSASSSEEV